MISGSTLYHQGYGWGSPLNAKGSPPFSWVGTQYRYGDEAGALYQGGSFLLLEDAAPHAWDDYDFQFFAYTASTRGTGMLFRAQSPSTFYCYRFDTISWKHVIVRYVNGNATLLQSYVQPTPTRQQLLNVWFVIRAIVSGPHIQVYNDNRVVFDFYDNSPSVLLTGTIGLWAWMGYNNLYDSVLVQSVSLTGSLTAATVAFSGTGITSLANIDASWASIGQMGAPMGMVPVRTDIDGTLVTTRTMFSCRAQTRRVAANAAALQPLTIPVKVHGEADPGDFFIVGGNSAGLFGVDQYSGQLYSCMLQNRYLTSQAIR
jgi:hypothetical protein